MIETPIGFRDQCTAFARGRLGIALALWAGCFLLLLRTLAPTIYFLDSAELTTGAATLGIVHAPGYALYLLIAHLFTRLPVGDIGFRINLLSALCLSLTAPILYASLADVVEDNAIAVGVTLAFLFSYYVWAAGVAAEVYAPQILTVALCVRLAVTMARDSRVRNRLALWMGLAVGLAVAMHPSSALLTPAIVATFLGLRVPIRRSAAAAGLSVAVFAACLIYFPLRSLAHPALNLAGSYAADGSFEPANLASLSGLIWFLRGGQFSHLFFDQGILPTLDEIKNLLLVFWNNYLGIGFLGGVIGLAVMARRRSVWLAVWLAGFIPYCLFYTAYDVPDRQFMYGPALLLWAIPLAVGLHWSLRALNTHLRAVVLLLPALMIAVNLPLLDLSHDHSARDRAEQALAALPENAVVFGNWLTIVPAQYLHIVEAQRPDTTLYNLFLFDPVPLSRYVADLLKQRARPVIFLSDDGKEDFSLDFLAPSLYDAEPVRLPDSAADTPPIAYRLTLR